jgi:hypothetical protein
MVNQHFVYDVRLAPAVRQAIDAERDRLLTECGLEDAMRWIAGVEAALHTLFLYSERCAVARESALVPARVHQLLVPSGQSRWRLLFSIQENDEAAPTTQVHLLRYNTQKPLTHGPPQE